MPISANYSMYLGEARTIPFTATNSNGTPFDLTSYTLTLSLSVALPSGGVFTLQKSSTNGGITITNAAGGVAQINMTTSDSTGLIAGSFQFDIVAGNVSTGAHVPLTTGFWVWVDHPNR